MADKASLVAPGVVAFNPHNGSQTAAAVKSDGSLQLLTVLDGPSAPSRYAFALTTAVGLTLQLLSDGAVAGFTPDGHIALSVEPAWATDANGNVVSTHYEIRGDNLIQVVDHNASGVAYPVVADPKMTWFWWGYAIKFTKSETSQIANSSSDAQALVLICTFIANMPGAAVCGVAGFIITSVYLGWLRGVVARGHCLQLNTAWAAPAIPYEVKC